MEMLFRVIGRAHRQKVCGWLKKFKSTLKAYSLIKKILKDWEPPRLQLLSSSHLLSALCLLSSLILHVSVLGFPATHSVFSYTFTSQLVVAGRLSKLLPCFTSIGWKTGSRSGSRRRRLLRLLRRRFFAYHGLAIRTQQEDGLLLHKPSG